MYKIPLSASTFGEEEVTAAIETIKSTYMTMGKQCIEFENAFADYVGSKNAIFVNSGSSANLLAFFSLNNPALQTGRLQRLKPGSEVIVPATSWSTTIWPIVQAGCVPVLVDSDPLTLQMKLEQVEQALSPKTAAICVVHVLGNATPMQPIMDLAFRHNLWVIEDTCESLGVWHADKQAGTWGDIGTYSFFFSHHMSTVEGGMIVTDNHDIAELCRCLRAHGWTRQLKGRQGVESKYPDMDPRFLFINTGFNLRPTEINAAFGLQQLKKLTAFNLRRRAISQVWDALLKPVCEQSQLSSMQETKATMGSWFGYPVVCESSAQRDALKTFLEAEGIETRPIMCGNLARQPALKHIKHRAMGDLSGADDIMDKGLFWGLHPMMSDEEVAFVSGSLKRYFNL